MAGILSGLDKLGLGNLTGVDLFAEEEEAKAVEKPEPKKAETPVFQETDYIYEKKFTCPVCDKPVTAKIMKTGRARAIGMDEDLRPRYEGIDGQKYDVILCQKCGYAALTRYYDVLIPAKKNLIKEHISTNVVLTKYDSDTISYEEAMERYKLALACSVVKKAKPSEKAYICLKTAWLLRGYQEELSSLGDASEKIAKLKVQEKEYLQNAYTGFIEARKSENFPIAGMDEKTLDYLLAQLAYTFGQLDVSAKLVAGILSSNNTSARIKDKARNLKDLIIAARNAGAKKN